MSLIGEAAMSAQIQRLLDKLTSSDLINWASSQEQLYHNLQEWEHMFTTVHAVLNDAENKHLTDSDVGRWLNRLRDLAYDVEDILDEFPPTRSSTTMNFNTVKEITLRLQRIKEQIFALGLKHCSQGEGRPYKIREGRETSSLEDDESLVRGRDPDKAALLKLLQLSPECSSISTPLPSHNFGGMGGPGSAAFPGFKVSPAAPPGKKLHVIPIIGMGGIGKTTLARLVYNVDQVKDSFHPRVWVCVSESFNVKELTKIILQKISREAPDHLRDLDLDSLQQKLKEQLDGKKFLMVLDDVWCQDNKKWDNLCRPLKAAASLGGTIIVTTRDHGVASSASMAGSSFSSHPFEGLSEADCISLEGLSEADCISLLTQHALGENDFKSHPELQLIGERIARKCKGSPLAAKTLGGLLQYKLKPDEWENVLKSNIWDLPQEESGILPALRLSYHHLPSSLKQCFAYFSIFPKDYEFKMEELILLWMAEGFLEQKNGRGKMEDLGKQYFHDLVSRSLLQQSSNDKSRYVMHDLTHDLAQFVAGEICFRLEVGLQGGNARKVHDKVRHCSYARGRWEFIKKFDPFLGKKHKRTLLALPISSPSPFNYIAEKLIGRFLPEFSCLRVLGLGGYQISELPDSFGELKQLRYLNLSSTAIICLPDSISGLCNLQSLLLDNCEKLSGLLIGMKSLINLRHLSMDNTVNLKEMPMGLGSLKGLQKLSKFIVGKAKGLGIQELEQLSDLHGGFLISGLENAVDDKEAMRAKLNEKKHLQKLELEWSRYIDDTDTANHQVHVIESLRPHTNIEALSISQYAGLEFPRWMVDPSFSKIVSIKLHNCKRCEFLPSLGKLQSLKNLWIGGLNEVRNVGAEFYGDGSSSIKFFSSLETLCFEYMENWGKWNGVDGDKFSCLSELSIINCHKLVKVWPLSLPSLRVLKLEGCKEVVFRSLRDLTSVTSLTIQNISELDCLGDEFNQQLESLEKLKIFYCGELRCLWRKTKDCHPKGLTHLRTIGIENCSILEYFGTEEKEEEGHLAPCNSPLVELSALAELRIQGCKMFVSFAGMRCPSLRHLEVRDCDAWERLTEGIMSPRESESRSDICPLECLKIESGPSFIRFPDGAIPKTLTQLDIENCDKLEALPDGIMNTCGLQELRLRGCGSLKHFPPGQLPISLKTLGIEDCPQIESIAEWKMMPSNICLEELDVGSNIYIKTLPECALVNLTKLTLWGCQGVESFWEGGFSAPNLKEIWLRGCDNLRHITDQIRSLTSLQRLDIFHCEGLERFPEAGFPTTLLSLWIFYCENIMQPISEWGLHKLTSLTNLGISGGCLDVVSFGEDFTLPSSLSSLALGGFPNLDSLSPRLSQTLTSLQFLSLRSCPKLQSFPKGLLELPQFSKLDIYDCPNLKRLCQKEKGEYWPYISLLPSVYIRGCDSDFSDEDSTQSEDSFQEEDSNLDDNAKSEK